MILECIVTTINADGSTNVAPMGPIVEDESFQSFMLRPFQSSTTFVNLNRSRAGVLHVTDDVGLFVDGALNSFDELPELEDASSVAGRILKDCCRFFEFTVTNINASNPRTELSCRLVNQGEKRPFLGFNRAKHAVLELTILATRIHILEKEIIAQQHAILKSAVDKTGSPNDLKAFQKIESYLRKNEIEICT